MVERICISCGWLKYMSRELETEFETGYYFTCGCYESTRYELPVDPEDTCICFREGSEEK